MTLDELATAIRKTSSDSVALQLADLLSGWIDDEADATELARTVEHFVGNTWIASSAEHSFRIGVNLLKTSRISID